MDKEEQIGNYKCHIENYKKINSLYNNNISDTNTDYKLKSRLLDKIIMEMEDILRELESD